MQQDSIEVFDCYCFIRFLPFVFYWSVYGLSECLSHYSTALEAALFTQDVEICPRFCLPCKDTPLYLFAFHEVWFGILKLVPFACNLYNHSRLLWYRYTIHQCVCAPLYQYCSVCLAHPYCHLYTQPSLDLLYRIVVAPKSCVTHHIRSSILSHPWGGQ